MEVIMNHSSSRRNFLRTSVFSASAIVLPQACKTVGSEGQSASVELNKNPLKLGVMTYNLAKDWDIETIIKNLGEAGYQSVELRTTHAHGIEVSLGSSERAEVKKRFEDSPLEVISLASAFAYHHPDKDELRNSIEGTKEFILLARDVGAVGIRVFPNALPEEVPVEKTLEQIGKSLAEVCEFGYNQGVDVRLCMHGKGTKNPSSIIKILDYSQSPHVYINWNCNPEDMEGEGFEHNFNLIKNRIKSLHLHELWDENYPYRKLFRLLSEMNFSGYCNAEIEGNPDPVRFLKYYRGLFLALQNAL